MGKAHKRGDDGEEMTVFRYATRHLIADYGRSGLGLIATAGPLALVPGMIPAFSVVFAVAAMGFAAYGARTGLRHTTRLMVDDRGVALLNAVGRRGTHRRLAWDQLDLLRLTYYAPRRRGREPTGGRWHEHGWLQLTLAGEGRRIKVDSSLERFSDFLRLALDRADARGVAVDQTTRANLDALGMGTQGSEALPDDIGNNSELT